MWRIQGLVGRVLYRCHGSAPLRLPQNHHVEDEVLNNSAVLSTSRQSSNNSSQQEAGGDRREKERTFQFGYAELPHYTVLDAVGWSAAAALFVQICRRIHSQFSSGTEPSPTPGVLTAPIALRKCGYRILWEILSRRDVLPRGKSLFCLPGLPEGHHQDQAEAQSSSSSGSSGGARLQCSSISDHHEADFNKDSPAPDIEESLLSASRPLQNDANKENAGIECGNDEDMSNEERLERATLNLRHVGDSSISVTLNIIGLESAQSENYEEAFTCFLEAAQQGYSKAQFNVGVCYEKGRGVGMDKEKAMYHYRQAAVGGHTQAQYRYAKLLLTSKVQKNLEVLNTVVTLLEQAAAAGHTQAQLCLASVLSQEPVRDGSRSVQYLKMAAENGDDTALLLLGQCYESGFGVSPNLSTAMEFYKRAARGGNKQAQGLLTPPRGTHIKDAMLRSIRSSPAFSANDHGAKQPPSALAGRLLPPLARRHVGLALLPHSWSEGSLRAPSAASTAPLRLHPRSTEGGACQWTVGVG